MVLQSISNTQVIACHSSNVSSFDISLRFTDNICINIGTYRQCTSKGNNKWNFVFLKVGCSSKIHGYLNNNVDLEIEKSFHQGLQISNYIGNISESFYGYIWSVQIYYECIDRSLLFKHRNSGTAACYVEVCDTSCAYQIIIDESFYCLPINFTDSTKTSYDLTGSSCGSFCSGTCVECNCAYKSFVISNGEAKGCLCSNGIYGTNADCVCPTGFTYNSSYLGCYNQSCYP